VNAAGGGPIEFTSVGTWEWSPTEDVLAMTQTVDGVKALALVRPGQSPTRVDVPPDVSPADVSFAPDGRRLAVLDWKTPLLDPGKLWVTDVVSCSASCSLHPVPIKASDVDSIDVRYATFAGWAGDGSRVLVRLNPIGSGSFQLDGLPLASIPFDGGGAVLMEQTPLVKQSWVQPLPGGRDAVIDAGTGRAWFDTKRELDTCDLVTGTCAVLVAEAGPVLDPDLSPDGTRLAYVQTDDIHPQKMPDDSMRWSASRRLVIANSDGSDPRTLTGDGVIQPRWTGDGHHIVFVRSGYLWVIDDRGGEPAAIAGPIDIPIEAGLGSFEQSPYIWPGDEVWASADLSR
jgi:dipeptidyl aminopeptidase/acylaminoacyl peptidase